jgi:aminomethyltransferase
MVPFAGYDMPVQYTAGVMKEHLHTRADAGLFDVSHMGQVTCYGQIRLQVADAALALEKLVPRCAWARSPAASATRFSPMTTAASSTT